ncbi:Uroporphyrinogen decarboxylase (URO-D) [Sporobacter termitidis DSM 10068]|uniref:Uroporphyrinogen decarboxylase (URO-D) n=1 Tax=Sporobacter termitidis DSM 10068 TaxID=1123282 RepID=A0A1M5WGY8_9FIRM|nr:uroporphyrinogen decarboxylase family protein [Sporobacter termitidis]SHH86782.1 Uroporphyrinogen decarboxylase (URO-D) [Sporobacter termitidis DSM 10068]
MAYKEIHIPTIPKPWPLPRREYPISPRENLMRALRHEKPVWMPNLYGSSQAFQSAIARDSPIERDRDAEDWFGVRYKYSAAQGSNTPQGNVLKDITEWEENIKWHDLSQYDWAADAARLSRDESLALFMRMSNGPFERLHMLEGFEQALVDLITEPEAVHAFLMRLVDFKIELFNRIRDHLALDYIWAADDYGTMRAPFFSTALFEKTILEPTVRFVTAVHARGTKFIAHCCGKIDVFIPYLVEEIGVDGLEIQSLNDIPGILEKYGDRVTVEYGPDPRLVYDPDTTAAQVRAHARDIVDRLGAQAVPGSGVALSVGSGFEHLFYPMEEEFYEYSKARYAGL